MRYTSLSKIKFIHYSWTWVISLNWEISYDNMRCLLLNDFFHIHDYYRWKERCFVIMYKNEKKDKKLSWTKTVYKHIYFFIINCAYLTQKKWRKKRILWYLIRHKIHSIQVNSYPFCTEYCKFDIHRYIFTFKLAHEF